MFQQCFNCTQIEKNMTSYDVLLGGRCIMMAVECYLRCWKLEGSKKQRDTFYVEPPWVFAKAQVRNCGLSSPFFQSIFLRPFLEPWQPWGGLLWCFCLYPGLAAMWSFPGKPTALFGLHTSSLEPWSCPICMVRPSTASKRCQEETLKMVPTNSVGLLKTYWDPSKSYGTWRN